MALVGHTKIMDKIEISRSFSRKVQIKQFEPVEVFCSAKAEVDPKNAEEASKRLFSFCKSEVINSITEIKEKGVERKDDARESVELDLNSDHLADL